MNESIRRMRAKRAAGSGGFTLIELLVVIVILGILAAVVVFAVQGVGDKGSSAAFATDVKTLRTAQEAYCAQNGSYAANDAALVGGRFLSEGGTLNRTVKTASGPCGGTGFAVVCKPTHPSCGSNGTFPDGNFDGSAPLGTWSKVGDLPAGSMVNGSMATMSNGKVLLFGRSSTASPPTVANASQGFLPGPVAIYNPATATWTAAPTVPTPASYPNSPNYNPLVQTTLIPLTGTSAECGSNCGKVLVAAEVGASPFGGQARSIGPDYLNQQFFLFDPVAFDAGANPWTRVPDPPATGKIGFFARMVQIKDCTRASAADCGKVLVTGGIDGNGIDPLSGGTYDPARFRTSLWDPAMALSPASWSLTDLYGRTVTATSATGSTTVTSPDANFTADDVGKNLVFVPGTSGAPRIANVVNSTTVNLSVAATVGGTTAPASPAVLWVADVSSTSVIVSLRDGRILVANGTSLTSGDSATYSPLTQKWLGTGNRLADLTYTCPGNPTTTTRAHSTILGGSSTVLADGRIFAPSTASGNSFSGNGSCNIVGAGTPPQNSAVFDPSNPAALWSAAPGVCPCSGGRVPNVVTLPPAFGSKVLMVYALGSNPKRTVNDAVVTSGNTTITSATANFTATDKGRALVGTGIRNGAIINTVNSATSVTMNSGFTATANANPGTVSIGNGWATSALYDGITWTSIDPASAPTPRLVDNAGIPLASTSNGPGYPTLMATMAVLPSGQVLIAGGDRCANPIATCAAGTSFTGRTDTWLYTPGVG